MSIQANMLLIMAGLYLLGVPFPSWPSWYVIPLIGILIVLGVVDYIVESDYKKDDWYVEMQEIKREQKELKRKAMMDKIRASIGI